MHLFFCLVMLNNFLVIPILKETNNIKLGLVNVNELIGTLPVIGPKTIKMLSL